MGIQPTNAGIDFQQRISACVMINMLFDIKLSNLLSVSENKLIMEMTFESNEAIDDLVIRLEEDKKVYLQMKRSISLSSEANSEFYSVCNQFVKQYLKGNRDDVAYVLVTSHNASGNICETLRRILDGIRTSNSFEVVEAFNKKEKEIYIKVISILKDIYESITHYALEETQLLELLKKSYVDVLDVENNQEYEKIMKMILNVRGAVDAELVWSYLIKSALNYASNRQIITKAFLMNNLKIYLKNDIERDREEFFKDKINVTYQTDNIEVKTDYILALENENINQLFNIQRQDNNETKMYLLDLYRFDEQGNKRIEYYPENKVKLANGITLEIVRRSATFLDVERFVNSNEFEQKFSGYSLYVIKSREGGGNVEKEKLHKEYLKRHWEENGTAKCLNCGKAIFQEDTFLCELDDVETTNEMGMIHKECLLPVNRILGIAKMSVKEDYSYLKNFDVNLWIRLIKNGQYFSGGLQKITLNIVNMTVETKNVFNQGSYMIKTYLEGGNFRYLTDKGKIDRFSKEEAQHFVAWMNERIQEGKEENNPWCYSSESFTFGQYDNLVNMLGGKEEYLECQYSEIVKYNESVASLYSKCKNFYAPLIYLTVQDKPIIVNGAFPLFTNPLEIKSYINNWNRAGIEIENFKVNIIKDDNEFRLHIIELIEDKIRPIANMKIGKKGELINGIVFSLMKELESCETHTQENNMS